jgi:predicted transcriptional regulator
MSAKEIHIGQLIKKVVRESNIKDVDFAKKISKSKQNVYDLYKRNDVEVKLLLTVSQALDYDFFQHFSKREKQQETEVSVQLKVKSENLDELFKWISENGNISIKQNTNN